MGFRAKNVWFGVMIVPVTPLFWLLTTPLRWEQKLEYLLYITAASLRQRIWISKHLHLQQPGPRLQTYFITCINTLAVDYDLLSGVPFVSLSGTVLEGRGRSSWRCSGFV